MQIIITMAGLGTRFRNAGYTCPKYMIEVKGKTLFEWSLESLRDYNPHVSKYIFVVLKADNSREFITSASEMLRLPAIEICELDHVTAGQAETCRIAIDFCDPEESVMVYNIDTHVADMALKYQDIDGDGYLPCFNAPGTHWSFARTDESGNVVEVREKQRISDNCTLGAYYFSSARLYRDLYDEFYDELLMNSEQD